MTFNHYNIGSNPIGSIDFKYIWIMCITCSTLIEKAEQMDMLELVDRPQLEWGDGDHTSSNLVIYILSRLMGRSWTFGVYSECSNHSSRR